VSLDREGKVRPQMEKELNVVGKRLPMHDAAIKTKGTAQFTDDSSERY
jgi:hypothetical protein